jgi:hypothetical protein
MDALKKLHGIYSYLLSKHNYGLQEAIPATTGSNSFLRLSGNTTLGEL